jgi:hypothetical protein
MEPMKVDDIDEWPTSLTTKEVKFFLGLGNFDTKVTQNDEDLTKPQNKRNKNRQDNDDTIVLPEDLSLNLLDYEFNDERTFENDDEQFDLIKTLSVHEPKILHSHFSKSYHGNFCQ